MTLDIGRQEIIPALRKAFGFRGKTEFALSESVLPVFDTTDPEPPYHNRIGGVVGAGVGPSVGNISVVGLGFPAGVPPNAVAVVREIHLFAPAAATAQEVRIAVVQASDVPTYALTGSLGGKWDSYVGTPVVQSLGITPAAAPFLTAPKSFNTWAGGGGGAGAAPTRIQRPFVVRPGFLLICESVSVNIQLYGGFHFDEYYVS